MSSTTDVKVHVDTTAVVAPVVAPLTAAEVTSEAAAIIAGLKKAYSGPLTVVEMMTVLTSAMDLAEKLPAMDGPSKKSVVLSALQQFIDGQSNINPIYKVAIDFFLVNVAPGAIDSVVYLAKHPPSFAKSGSKGCLCC